MHCTVVVWFVVHVLMSVVCVCVWHELCGRSSRNLAAFHVTCRCGFCVVYIVEFCAMCFSLSCIIQFVVCAVS